MLCNKSTCKACAHYKEISKIINNTVFTMNIVDPATFIRKKINSTFKITKEECEILERIKLTHDYSEYKNYLLRSSHYITCDKDSINNITIIIKHTPYICCTEFFYTESHDTRCMYKYL